MGVGRFVCVAVPLVLTVASIIALLVATLSGVTHTQLWMFEIDTTNLSISPAEAANIAGKLGVLPRQVKLGNISAADLGLANKYEVNLWGYCSTAPDGKRECTKAQFDWANSALNTSVLEQLTSATGVTLKLPNEIKNALKTFRTVTKWTEVAFIVALVALGAELVFGIFANCSRAVSCCTWLFASIAAVLVGVAAGLATAMSTVVVGSVEGTAKFYGVQGTVGGRFLAATWIGAAFAIGAAFFWIFTICCCKPDHRRKSGAAKYRDHHNDGGEKLLPPTGTYRPLSHNYEMQGGSGGGGQPNGFYNPAQHQTGMSAGPRHPSGQGRTDLAYEPYTHRV
ncbi:integral membrane protein [Moelleriella libera RCEF 2490]|uniref:Integral membrane protein n=1 Tax=Moelleriella libera RCEF 2490 TaxID=1081109 RepID=A0A167Z2A1_9HYPO|nr:integral membrane protein [Moelleriella libera RCEF 2490]